MEANMTTDSGRVRSRDDSDASMAQQTTSTLMQPPKASSPIFPSSKPAPSKRPKRIKRKCSHPLCQNHVVQGGVCVTHGARRKMCTYPGCIKAAKLAGYCSGHGSTRIVKCNETGCSRVAVMGGCCLSHGTIQRICNFPMANRGSCVKPAFIGGLCKDHHERISKTRGAHDPMVLCTQQSLNNLQFQRAGEATIDLETFVYRQELEAMRRFQQQQQQQQQHLATHSSEGSSRSNIGYAFIPPALLPPARFNAGGGWVWAPPTGALSAPYYQWPHVTTFQPRVALSTKELNNAGMNTSRIDRSDYALPILSSSDGDDGIKLPKQRESHQIPLIPPSLSSTNHSCTDSQDSITSDIMQRSKDSKIKGPLYSSPHSKSAHRGNENVDTSVPLCPIHDDEILQESVLLINSLHGNESLHTSIDDGKMLTEEMLNRSSTQELKNMSTSIFVPNNHTNAEYQIDSSPSSNNVLTAASQMWPCIYRSPISLSQTYSSSDNSRTIKDSKHVIADMLSKVNQFEESDNAGTNERGDSNFSGLSLLSIMSSLMTEITPSSKSSSNSSSNSFFRSSSDLLSQLSLQSFSDSSSQLPSRSTSDTFSSFIGHLEDSQEGILASNDNEDQDEIGKMTGRG